MMGKLYIVATPIGNLEDITLRAMRILTNVDIIACEDTRKTGILLGRLKIPSQANFCSFYEENEEFRIPFLIKKLLAGKSVALVSNAGTPAISDPGFRLIRKAVEKNIPVISVPGPSAILAALTSSGLPTDKFIFLGFLPLKPIKRKRIWAKIKQMAATTVIFESPPRLLKTLAEIKATFGDVPVAVCRELTKMFEKTYRGPVQEVINQLKEGKLQGEIVIILGL